MKSLVSILLSLLILLSSSGVTYAKHFCGPFEMGSKITLGEASLSCSMAMEKDACGDETREKHSCCSNTYLKVTTDHNFAKVSFNFNFQVVWVFMPADIFEFADLAVITQKIIPYNLYRPPPLIENLQVRYETFLI